MVMVRKDFYNIKSEMDRQHPCQICDMPYSISEKSCPFCDSPSKICSSKRNLSKIQCPKCSFENDLSNPVCVACDASFDPDQDKKVPCDHCGMQVLKRLIDQHSTNCMLSMELIKQAQKEEAAMKELLNYQLTEIECKYCHVKIPGDLIEDHNEVCVSKPKPKPVPLVVSKPVKIPPPKKPDYGSISSKHFKPGNKLEPAVMEPYEPIEIAAQIKQNELFSEAELARLTKLQKDAILYMHARSLKQHTAAQKALQQRTKKLGFKKEDLENLLFYIENHAPIIIHIHILKHMEFFIKDTHYRSQFETNKSSGSLSRQSRTEWENRMFDKHYAKATDFERVKYGVINFTNDPKGVNCALGYGLSYFLLKEHVRNRCTMTDMDSSSATSLIGTFKYCFHILNKTNDQQLKSAFNAAKALEQSSSVTTTYKEIQIHGPIEFAKDIERIYVNRKEVQDKKYLDMVYAFCERNKVEMEFI